MIVRHCTGQTSMQASHSMHSGAWKTVSMSQLRQRWTSWTVCSAVNPSSTSVESEAKRRVSSTWVICWRGEGL